MDFYFSGWPHPPIINAHLQNMIYSTVPSMLKNHVSRCADPTPALRAHVTYTYRPYLWTIYHFVFPPVWTSPSVQVKIVFRIKGRFQSPASTLRYGCRGPYCLIRQSFFHFAGFPWLCRIREDRWYLIYHFHLQIQWIPNGSTISTASSKLLPFHWLSMASPKIISVSSFDSVNSKRSTISTDFL